MRSQLHIHQQVWELIHFTTNLWNTNWNSLKWLSDPFNPYHFILVVTFDLDPLSVVNDESLCCVYKATSHPWKFLRKSYRRFDQPTTYFHITKTLSSRLFLQKEEKKKWMNWIGRKNFSLFSSTYSKWIEYLVGRQDWVSCRSDLVPNCLHNFFSSFFLWSILWDSRYLLKKVEK